MTTLQTVRPVRVARRLSPATLGIVAALHLVIIYGIYEGLKNNWTIPKAEPPIDYAYVPEAKHQPLPPVPIDIKHFVKPTIPSIPRPDIPIEPDQGLRGITQNTGTTDNPQPPTGIFAVAQGILSTHTIPAYPPIAVRLNQTGNVKLRLTIDEQGVVTAASVEKSSGYDSLDNAAVAWVIAHWRYRPATKDGAPIASSSDALVTFRLTGG
jgi:periplasmic protein TonB